VSDDENPEFQALEELETVVRNLADQMAAWRRRALKAESQRSEFGADHDVVGTRERIVELEETNVDLRNRLDGARERVDRLVGRLRFLEEQAGVEERAG